MFGVFSMREPIPSVTPLALYERDGATVLIDPVQVGNFGSKGVTGSDASTQQRRPESAWDPLPSLEPAQARGQWPQSSEPCPIPFPDGGIQFLDFQRRSRCEKLEIWWSSARRRISAGVRAAGA